MNDFKTFGIKPAEQAFTGDKIKMERILNRKITVHHFRIERSKYEKGNGDCLYMQITTDNAKRVVFSGSATLMDMIKKVPAEGFPFTTTIIKENDRYEFT